MDEASIERRAHWVQWIAGAIIVATAWCVKLEMTTAGLKSDMEIQHTRRDATIKEMNERQRGDHDAIVTLLQWKRDKGG